MSQSRVNLEVFCKRNGTRGIVVAEDKDIITIQTNGVNKAVTENTFKRWYTIVPQDNDEADTVEEKIQAESTPAVESVEESSDNETHNKVNPAGEVGAGLELRNKFLEIVKQGANDGLDFTYDEKNSKDIIKYNGKNVFECTTARRRFNVLCHQKALTADNLRRAHKVFPKEWSWVLNVKYVFTDMSQVPLMRSIVTDSLYFRSEYKDD